LNFQVVSLNFPSFSLIFDEFLVNYEVVKMVEVRMKGAWFKRGEEGPKTIKAQLSLLSKLSKGQFSHFELSRRAISSFCAFFYKN